MAGFKTHVTTSTVIGVGYGAAAHFGFDAPLATSMLAGGLCSVAGMLPDIDSDTGVPIRESTCFAAAFVPMLLVNRFRDMGLSFEAIVLAGALTYIVIRFALAEILKRYTVHRGMWHSVPAAGIAGLATYLACPADEPAMRLLLAGGVVLGFMTHLLLDEIWSVDWSGGFPRIKKSFGTAIKFFSRSRWANISTYGKLMALVTLAMAPPWAEVDSHDAPPPEVVEQPQPGDGVVPVGHIGDGAGATANREPNSPRVATEPGAGGQPPR